MSTQKYQEMLAKIPACYHKYTSRDYYCDHTGFNSTKIEQMNAYLRTFYHKYINLKNSITSSWTLEQETYKLIVGYNEPPFDWNRDSLQQLEDMCDYNSFIFDEMEKKDTDIVMLLKGGCDYNFANVSIEHSRKNNYMNFMDAIKVYISIKDGNISQLFLDSVQHMKKVGNFRMHAKISARGRFESFIYWLSSEDFPKLKAFLEPHKSRFYSPLKFLPYTDGYGISKEFALSYHELLMQMLILHFDKVKNETDINILDMFDEYFNINQSVYYTYKDMAVVSATKDLILGKESFSDVPAASTHILLNSDKQLWEPLRLHFNNQ